MYYIGIVFLLVLESLGAVETLEFAAHVEFPGAVRVLATAFVLILAVTVLVGSSFTAKLGTLFFLTVCFTLLSYFVSFGLAYKSGIPDVGLNGNNFEVEIFQMVSHNTR